MMKEREGAEGGGIKEAEREQRSAEGRQRGDREGAKKGQKRGIEGA